MKRIFAIMLTVCMLLSMAALFVIPAAAVDGEWNVYGNAKDYRDYFDEEEDELSNVPGYEYIWGEGLKTISPNWEESAPKVGVQTKEKVNLKAGVYMLVRIDEFSYTASDKWFAFSISDTQYVNVGSGSAEKDGERVVALIRSGADTMSQVQWNHANYQWSGTSQMTAPQDKKFDENGKALLELVITWDYANSSYNVTVNGAPIHATALAWMNEHFANGEAYIGINIQNNEKGGDAGLTVLKYGTDAVSATTPLADDYATPVNYEHLYMNADIEDASTVDAGQPAIFMNGSRFESDSKFTFKDDENQQLTAENYKHFAADRTKLEISFSVKNTVSYAIEDFPIILVLTRNYCNCSYGTGCWAYEACNMYVMAGDVIAAGDDHKVTNISPECMEGIEVGNDTYLYFMVDASAEAKTKDMTGRINGIRFDILDIDIETPGRNEFDVCFAAFFRNTDEAEEYVNTFLGLNEDDGDDTQAPSDNETDTAPETTEPKAPETTEPKAPETTEPKAPETTEAKTPETTESKAPANTETEAKAPAATEKGDDNASSGGCGSTVGFGAFAIVAVVSAAGFAAFKKRR